ncbi:methyltransferase, TIGR04325 family [Bradyrhizobium erythrophlei]|nr:methyltransferase, TIGR04325 family [Bradyrhizobium erythrophlei]
MEKSRPVLKRLARFLMPPGLPWLMHRIKHGNTGLVGAYPSWEEAKKHSCGYDEDQIVARIVNTTRAVVDSEEQLFDRDGVIFRAAMPPFPLLTFLLRSAIRSGDSLSVLDFGGALGSTYRQCQPFLKDIRSVRWHIVETPKLVVAGREFATENLRFFETIEPATLEMEPDIVLFSGVLQYLDDPFGILAKAVSLNPEFIVVDRNPFCSSARDLYTVQVVSDEIFPARLPFRAFSNEKFASVFGGDYLEIGQFETVDPEMFVRGESVRFLGKVWERRSERGNLHVV